MTRSRCSRTCSWPSCRAGPPLYPQDMNSDEPAEMMIAEFIREAALEGVRDELPHSIAVTIAELRTA